MWSGPSALKNIDSALQDIRNAVVGLDRQLTDLSEETGGNERRRAQIINDIARIRLVALESGDLQAELGAADERAQALLDQRLVALQRLNEQIDQLHQQLGEQEQARERLLSEQNGFSAELANIEAQVQKDLQQDPAYLDLLGQARDAESVASEAARKVAEAQQDMTEKAKPYLADALFMYLWDCGYGTTDYQGGLIARMIDGWVARLIDFAPARVNYWNLNEIPLRLQQHAETVRENAEAQHDVLQQYEQSTLDTAGAAELHQQLEAVQQSLDEHDDKLEAREDQLNQLLAERGEFVAGEDDYIKQCVTLLSAALKHRDLQTVHHYVQATHSPTDDSLLLELRRLAERNDRVVAELSALRGLHDKKVSQLHELEGVRRDFKNSRFDDARSGFSNESLIAQMLAEFVKGMISGSDVWRTLKKSQRYRDIGVDPDFGSGGIGNIGDILGGGGRRKRRSSWNIPRPRRGGGGFSRPRRGGGGFKTGGGF